MLMLLALVYFIDVSIDANPLWIPARSGDEMRKSDADSNKPNKANPFWYVKESDTDSDKPNSANPLRIFGVRHADDYNNDGVDPDDRQDDSV